MSRQDWRTPPSVFDALNKRFGPFDCDVAADDLNHLCERYLTAADGVPDASGWGRNNWCNPTFANIMPFMQPAAILAAMRRPGHTVMLSHSNANSPWFQFAIDHAALYCPDNRINYWHPDEDAKHGANRDSVVWHFGGEPGRVYAIEIPDHIHEVRRLTAEAKGQLTIAAGGLF